MNSGKVVIGASSKHTATVIFFHGRGDTGSGYGFDHYAISHGWANHLKKIIPSFAKLVCPTAPNVKVTLSEGAIMPAWFDMKGLDPTAVEDTEGIEKAATAVLSLIEEEIKGGIASQRIVIGGFSQGGALSLYSSLRTSHSLGGVVALSCWLPLRESFPAKIAGNTGTPILICHGNKDDRISYEWGKDSADILKKFNELVDFRSYQTLGHWSSEEEMEDVKIFIEKCLPHL